MAEEIKIDLTLDDKVSGPAAKAAAELRRLQEQAKSAGKALDFSAEIQKVEHALAKIKTDPQGFKGLIKAQKELREEQMKLGKASWATKGAEEFAGKLRNAIGAIAIADLLFQGVERVVDFLSEGIKKAFEAAGEGEKTRLSARYLYGSKERADSAMEDQERIAKLTRYNAEEILDQQRPLVNAGLKDQKDIDTLWAAASDQAIRLHGSVSEFVEIFAKILNKEAFTSKQLANGLQDNVTEFYASLGKALRVSPKKAEEMAAKTGAIDPRLVLKTYLASIEKKQGAPIAEPTYKDSLTFDAVTKKLADLPREYAKELSKAPEWSNMTDVIRNRMLGGLDPNSENGKKISKTLLDSFTKLFDAMANAFTVDNIKNLTNAIIILSKAMALFGRGAVGSASYFVKRATIDRALFTAPDVLDKVNKSLTPKERIQASGSDEATVSAAAKARDRGVITQEEFESVLASTGVTDAPGQQVSSPFIRSALTPVKSAPVNLPDVNINQTFNGPADPDKVGEAATAGAKKGIDHHMQKAADETGRNGGK